MVKEYNVKDKKVKKKLEGSKRFMKYPNMFLSNTCKVKVNADDYLIADDFTIYCKAKILPKKIYIYGKKTKPQEENNLYLNYWMEVFFKTIENGNLCKQDFKKCTSKAELTIGIPSRLRFHAYHYRSWNRANIIEFLSCLFNIPVEETNYEQQDFIEQMLVA